MSLATRYLGLHLAHPIVAAASPLTATGLLSPGRAAAPPAAPDRSHVRDGPAGR